MAILDGLKDLDITDHMESVKSWSISAYEKVSSVHNSSVSTVQENASALMDKINLKASLLQSDNDIVHQAVKAQDNVVNQGLLTPLPQNIEQSSVFNVMMSGRDFILNTAAQSPMESGIIAGACITAAVALAYVKIIEKHDHASNRNQLNDGEHYECGNGSDHEIDKGSMDHSGIYREDECNQQEKYNHEWAGS